MAEAMKELALGTSPFPQWQDVLVAVYHLVSPGDPGLIHCMVKVCLGDSSLAPVMRLGGPKVPGRTQTMSPLLTVVSDSESLLPQWGHPSVFEAEELYLCCFYQFHGFSCASSILRPSTPTHILS